MRTTISDLSEAALRGDWGPLIRESEKARGKHWAENARCSGRDTDMFFPLGDGPQAEPMETVERLGLSLVRPLNLCAACPLSTAARCLIESLRNDEEFGIRGGLIASERSTLRASWQKRTDENAVGRALRGSTAALSKAERNEVIARFAADPTMDATAVARGLGITHEYLLKLARTHRQKRRSELAAPPVRSADAA
ncbi:WhiB family transcriptional regulator [Streptomyces sp. NPDC127114]|uniref:WhiB family transcriptional regulator n=1 Tax=Streptomyces sp. NPDC127114 TaxID=3345366 RepID=UPI0036253F85